MNINYNNRITLRWNNWFRRFFILPKMRKALRNKEFTLLSNNCNGGFIYHDLGLQFLSPTINMFFYHDHYLTFLEHLDDYLASELKICVSPLHKTDLKYPIFNLGGANGLPLIELHFLHYHEADNAIKIWNKRCNRINRNNLFAIFSFFDDTDECWLKRFDAIDIKNKIAFVNHPYPQYKSAVYIPGYEAEGLGLLNQYVNCFGRRKYDYFNFVEWFNVYCGR